MDEKYSFNLWRMYHSHINIKRNIIVSYLRVYQLNFLKFWMYNCSFVGRHYNHDMFIDSNIDWFLLIVWLRSMSGGSAFQQWVPWSPPMRWPTVCLKFYTTIDPGAYRRLWSSHWFFLVTSLCKHCKMALVGSFQLSSELESVFIESSILSWKDCK